MITNRTEPAERAEPQPQPPEVESEPDFAEEHASTAVDERILSDRSDREPESPRGWSGME
ncbi:hypothetical protein GCM10010123_28590 [Pilimelia anulata]|uniref:Uncharacterized protein n=1 Tax=Pilimelia anulata TaxID=53371 RepID=A0A8J3FAE2_9ACTN|nr:hypothetical protein [Pilimelia anulata]GGJ96882.1 hypothetical protein GCM10010123_28590 [Pilimelia anulata]